MSAADASTLCEHAMGVLADLHSVDPFASPDLAAFARGEGYVARQVAGWTDRFARARTDDTGDWSDITAWLDEHQPADVAQRLIHNDFRFDNMVLDADDPLRVVGVLDWEMATVGDPLMDLGGMLAYWVEEGDDEFFQMFRRQPTTAPGMWTRDRIVEHYCDRMGFEMTPERWRFYEVFGLFRLAVIAQQIWYRYFHGQTTNEAYAVFGPAVGYLETRCRRLVGPRVMGRGLMGVVLLVRHGQASFGADDYDVLSETGWTQSRLLGEHLAARGVVPDVVVRGRDAPAPRDGRGDARGRRLVGAGRGGPRLGRVRPPRRRRRPPGGAGPATASADPTESRRDFQRLFEAATRRWTSGDHERGLLRALHVVPLAGARRADPRQRARRPRRHGRRGHLRRPDRHRRRPPRRPRLHRRHRATRSRSSPTTAPAPAPTPTRSPPSSGRASTPSS